MIRNYLLYILSSLHRNWHKDIHTARVKRAQKRRAKENEVGKCGMIDSRLPKDRHDDYSQFSA